MNKITNALPQPVPSLFSIGSAQNYWFAHTEGFRRSLQIQMPVKEVFPQGYAADSGLLTLSPPILGTDRLRHGLWSLEAPYTKGKGWHLTVGIRAKPDQRFQITTFAFWSRDAGHDLPVWVNRLNRRLARTLGPVPKP